MSLVLGKEKRKTRYQNNAGGTAVFDETLTWMSKGLMESMLEVGVYDKDTLSDDFLGGTRMNINLLKLEEGAESEAPVAVETTAKDGKPAGKVLLMFSRKAVPEGAFEGILHVTVQSIEGFSDTAGFMDRTDPYVSLVLGKEKRKTRYQNNAGGTAVFDEVLTFQKKGLMDSTLGMMVFDKNTIVDTLLGEHVVDLNHYELQEDGSTDREGLETFELKDSRGQPAGKVSLMLSRKTPPGAFAGVLHVTVILVLVFLCAPVPESIS